MKALISRAKRIRHYFIESWSMIDVSWSRIKSYTSLLSPYTFKKNVHFVTCAWCLTCLSELKLQPNCPAPKCVRELLASLDEPCESNDNHKHANLPDSLKGFRFLKRSIGIYSDLVDKFWAQRGSNEAGWLRLLESQKSVHDTLLRALIWISIHCHIALRKDELLMSKNSVAGSQHSSLVLQKALDILVPRTLLWAEKGRATTLQNQLGPWYKTKRQQELDGFEPPGSLDKDMIIKFQKNHEVKQPSYMF